MVGARDGGTVHGVAHGAVLEACARGTGIHVVHIIQLVLHACVLAHWVRDWKDSSFL